MVGVKSIINDRKISGSVRGENTSMLKYWRDGVFLMVSDTMGYGRENHSPGGPPPLRFRPRPILR